MIIQDLFESPQQCPECGGPAFSDMILAEKKDACYSKVRSRYKVWPSAYASGALVQCRKKGAANWGNKSEGVAEGLGEDAARAEAQADYMQGQCMILAVAINQLNPERYPIGYIWEYNMSAGAPDMQLDDDEWEYLSPQEQEEISKDISRHSIVHAYVRDQETNEYIDARGRHKTLPNLWGRLGQTRFEEFPGTARELIDITAHGDWDEASEQVSFKRGRPAFDSLAGPAGVKRAQDYAVIYLGVEGSKNKATGTDQQGVAEGLVKDIKRLATGKDVKSRAGQEIAKSQDASMKGDNKTSKKHFDRYDKLDKLANKEQGVAEGLDKQALQKELIIINKLIKDMKNSWQQQHLLQKKQELLKQLKQGVAEGSGEAEAYKAHLIKTMPQMMNFLSKKVKGWTPGEEEMLGAIDTAYMVMKHTGDVKQAGKALMDELNTLHRMSQGKQGVAEGSDSEELADEVYAEFERIYPNLARRADERTIHAAIIDVLNYGGDSNPSALAQDVARAVKRDMQPGVAEGEKVGNMDADAFDDAMARLKKLAGAGPMKTVYDPNTRRYKNVPTAVQPKQQPSK
jgi:hypothetical protein